MGGAIPPNKNIFVRVPRTKISKGQIREESTPRGQTRKSATPPKIWTQFSRKRTIRFFVKFQWSKGFPQLKISAQQISPAGPVTVAAKKTKRIHLGACPQKLTPQPPWNPELKQGPLGGTRPWKNFGYSSSGCRENRIRKKFFSVPWQQKTGGDSPLTKIFLSQSLGRKSPTVKWEKEASQRGELGPSPKNFETHFLENFLRFFKFQRSKWTSVSVTFIQKLLVRNFRKMKKTEIFTLGGLAPKFDPRTPCPPKLK